jgi:hypothetical protein
MQLIREMLMISGFEKFVFRGLGERKYRDDVRIEEVSPGVLGFDDSEFRKIRVEHRTSGVEYYGILWAGGEVVLSHRPKERELLLRNSRYPSEALDTDSDNPDRSHDEGRAMNELEYRLLKKRLAKVVSVMVVTTAIIAAFGAMAVDLLPSESAFIS